MATDVPSNIILTEAEREGLADTTDNNDPDDLVPVTGKFEGDDGEQPEADENGMVSDGEEETVAPAAEAKPEAKPDEKPEPDAAQLEAERVANEAAEQAKAKAASEAQAIADGEAAVKAALEAQKAAIAAVGEKEAAVDALVDELEALAEKLEAGELTDAGYQAKVTALNVKIQRAQKEHDKAEAAADASDAKIAQSEQLLANAKKAAQVSTEAVANSWAKACDDFLASPDNKLFTERPTAYAALNQAVADVAKANPNYSHQKILAEARAEVAKDFPALNKQEPAKLTEPDKKPPKPKPELPTTLANIPAAVSNTDTSEFAHIDALLGTKGYEAAFGKLTAEQQKRYLTGR